VGDTEALKDLHEVLAGDAQIDGVIENHAGVFVDDGGDLESGVIFEVVGLETDHPHMISILRAQGRLAGAGTAAFRAPADRDPQALFMPKRSVFL